jgi:Plasma-membrane choline transporter
MRELNKDSSMAEFAAKCLICCVDCLERFVRFFNKHAYVEVVMRSTCFCVSAVNGMKIVGNNFLRFGILHGLGEIVMNMGIIFICLMGTYAGYLLIILLGPQKREFHGTALSLIVDIIITKGGFLLPVWCGLLIRPHLGSEQ